MKKFDKKALSGAAAAVIIVILLIGTFVVVYGYTTNWKFQLANNNGTNNVTPGAGIGTFEIGSSAYDTLIQTTPRTIATDVSVIYYHYVGGVWSRENVAAAATLTPVSLTAKDNGYIYAVVTTSSSYYLDAQTTSQMNPSMTYVGYENVISGSSTTLPQWVFKINLGNVIPGNRAIADISLTYYALTYDSGYAFGTLPANQTSVGTTLNTTTINWYVNAGTVSEGFAVTKLVLTTNETDSSQFTLKSQNIPGVGNIAGGTLSQLPQSSATLFTWTAPTNPLTGAVDLGSAIYWTYPSGGNNQFYLNSVIGTTLSAAGKGETFMLTVYGITPSGGGKSFSSSASITAGEYMLKG